MIDLHIHVLPHTDDGPSGLEEAIEMCRMCQDEGITTIVATPHLISGLYENDRRSIIRKVRSLHDALDNASVSLTVLPGSDVRLEPDVPSRLEASEICTVNDNGVYLLLELPETLSAMALTRAISGLKNSGIRPILSHPERSRFFHAQVQMLYNLTNSGVLLQITAGSLTGYFGKEIMDFSKRMLECRLVHVVASDAHSPHARPPGLLKALERASEILGKDEALALFTTNPLAIVEGEPFVPPPPTPWGKRSRNRWIRWVRGLYGP